MRLQTLFTSAVLGHDGDLAVMQPSEQERLDKLKHDESQRVGPGGTGLMLTGAGEATAKTEEAFTNNPKKKPAEEECSVALHALVQDASTFAERLAQERIDLHNQLQALEEEMQGNSAFILDQESTRDVITDARKAAYEEKEYDTVQGVDGQFRLENEALEEVLVQYERENNCEVNRHSFEDVDHALLHVAADLENNAGDLRMKNEYMQQQSIVIVAEIEELEVSAEAESPSSNNTESYASQQPSVEASSEGSGASPAPFPAGF